jgi:hypothetical protein
LQKKMWLGVRDDFRNWLIRTAGSEDALVQAVSYVVPVIGSMIAASIQRHGRCTLVRNLIRECRC